jgi:mono/diheme cytochrome c family protein
MSGRLAVASLGGLLAAGLLAIGLHTAGATEPRGAQAAGNAERGQRLFLVGCAYCHG